MSASKRRPKKKMSFKVSHKAPRNPVAKEVTKKRAGPMKDRRKESSWRDEDEYDSGDGAATPSVRTPDERSDPEPS